MKILEELWLGNVNPQEQKVKDSRMEQAISLIVKNDDTMRAMLSDTQKEQYEKVQDCQDALGDLQERRAFSEGFYLAMKIMMDMMKTMEVPSADG